MRVRKNVEVVCESKAETQALQAAIRLLKNAPGRNYADFVELHAQHAQHNNELFLPWHRAFILEFENALDDLVPGVTLPYWDWTLARRMPKCFDYPADVQQNPLYHPLRYTEVERANQTYPTEDQVTGALKIPDFLNFGGGPGPPTGRFFQGRLDVLHAFIHLWVGPQMTDIEHSPEDPIFWAHHSNVDRLWALWQTTHPCELPGAPLNTRLPGLENTTIGDVLHISELAYEYVYDGTDVVFDPPNVLRSGSLSKPSVAVPGRFSKAELRVRGLRGVDHFATPTYLDVFLNGNTNHCGTLPLFGLPSGGHASRIHAHHGTLSLNWDITTALSEISAGAPLVLNVMLSNRPRGDGERLLLGYDEIRLVFFS